MDRPFLEMSADQLLRAVEGAGQPAYRAEQLRRWVYQKGVTDPARMSNVPNRLVSAFTYLTSESTETHTARDGTVKLLVTLADAEQIETVLIPTARRRTACLSTQVGCAMGCSFCASGAAGWKRDLRSGEILEQLLHLRRATGERITHVVMMGIGEPLANIEATIAALRAIVDPQRFGLSARNVTVSTIGLPEGIRRLAREQLPVTLAISLHAPTDELRRTLIPAARTISIRQIVNAAKVFYRARKREITLEYALLDGINDTHTCAEQLAGICKKLRCNVNLIPYNPAGELPFRPPPPEKIRQFAHRLTRAGVNVNVRRPRGPGIEAACGQLRLREHSVPAQDEPQ